MSSSSLKKSVTPSIFRSPCKLTSPVSEVLLSMAYEGIVSRQALMALQVSGVCLSIVGTRVVSVGVGALVLAHEEIQGLERNELPRVLASKDNDNDNDNGLIHKFKCHCAKLLLEGRTYGT